MLIGGSVLSVDALVAKIDFLAEWWLVSAPIHDLADHADSREFRAVIEVVIERRNALHCRFIGQPNHEPIVDLLQLLGLATVQVHGLVAFEQQHADSLLALRIILQR